VNVRPVLVTTVTLRTPVVQGSVIVKSRVALAPVSTSTVLPLRVTVTLLSLKLMGTFRWM
jgi:hypothetical protein